MTTSLRVLLIGSGGREHALAWKLSRSPSVDKIFVVPGNGGTDSLERTTNVDLNPSDFNKLVEFAVEKGVTLVVPGPEQPLVDGVEEVFRKGSELPVWPKRMNE
jgi:phosphoribosylamine--glycine ligase/phosphoribosylformylglycinamidine cyclo-ligase